MILRDENSTHLRAIPRYPEAGGRASKREREREDWVAAVKTRGRGRGLPFRLFACLELGHGIVGAMLRNFENGPFSALPSLHNGGVPSKTRRRGRGGAEAD